MNRRSIIAIALTVAGSDSGGGAGIQADLKTFQAHGVFGTSAITCITAQNPDRVSTVRALTPGLVTEQMDRVFEAFPIGAAKTGMLYDAAIIQAVTHGFARHKFHKVVVDPVMVAGSGARLLKDDAITALVTKLFPRAAVVTPNLAEAEVLAKKSIRTVGELRATARLLAEKFGVPFLVKGGHLHDGKQAVDVLFDGKRFHEYRATRVANITSHGTGCAFSAAITANLALGWTLPESIARAKRFITSAIRGARKIRSYSVLRI
ncbi:MAG TPA: bifunctional hydroxymethylpyrimidine kinase/phosphomethylpyrimidine kinase [Verrucomicrobiae bacterium]|nr:bifunctional hydroxymethylpyrimidine kinase/phosphomethylpyrimidine kinase [Verrucomicrobiae bacterium]